LSLSFSFSIRSLSVLSSPPSLCERRGTEKKEIYVARTQDLAKHAEEKKLKSLTELRDNIRKLDKLSDSVPESIKKELDSAADSGRRLVSQQSSSAKTPKNYLMKKIKAGGDGWGFRHPKIRGWRVLIFWFTHVVYPVFKLSLFPLFFSFFFVVQFAFALFRLLSDVYIIVKSTVQDDLQELQERMELVEHKWRLFVSACTRAFHWIPEIPHFSLGTINIGLMGVWRACIKAISWLADVFDFSWVPATATACEGALAPGKLLTTSLVVVFLVFLFDSKVR